VTVTGDEPRTVRAATRLPSWIGSIRFRLAILYSTILFGLAVVVVAVIYIGLAHSLSEQPVTQRVRQFSELPTGDIVIGPEQERIDPYLYIEKEANQRALDTLRELAFGSLFMLFVASIGVGWSVSGRVLRPIERITDVARDIQATDLSRRINLDGPDDELKQLADTFDGMLGRIDEAFESQREFIHEASHELRNPLAVIRTNLDVTLADPEASEDDLRHTAEVVQKSTERMSRLVDDLLVYARKGRLSLERERVDAAAVVAEAADEFAASADAKHVRLERDTEEELWVDADRLALRQALANLLANALRVSPADTTIRLSAGRKPGWIWVGVEDQGPGIAEDDQDRVFQRFYRANGEGGEARSSGLGLTIVRQIAEAHGGEVRLVSEPGRGAAFAIWLPA
jgi:signal transduction histidine kinase